MEAAMALMLVSRHTSHSLSIVAQTAMHACMLKKTEVLCTERLGALSAYALDSRLRVVLFLELTTDHGVVGKIQDSCTGLMSCFAT